MFICCWIHKCAFVQGGVDDVKLMEEVSDISFDTPDEGGGIRCLGVSFPSSAFLMSLDGEIGCEGSNDLSDTAFGLNSFIPTRVSFGRRGAFAPLGISLQTCIPR